MIDPKILELINKDIDKTISLSEKDLLQKYINNDPEVNSTYHEMLETEKLLDKLPENDPSVSLKQRILNSINYDLYAKKHKVSFVDHVVDLFSVSNRKFATSFAFGLITGFIVLAAIFYSYYSDKPFKEDNVVGTMGISESKIVESIPINLAESDISGQMIVSKSSDKYFLDINIESKNDFSLQINVDPKSITIDNFSLNKPNDFNIEKELGSIKINGSQNSNYSLAFSLKDSVAKNINIKILSHDNKLYQKEIVF
jgi:hypothetical protein